MVREIVTYPDKRINITSPDVRTFDAALASVIEDLKDTMEAHHVDAMAAIQIAIPMAVVVIKREDGSYLELVNPRIIRKQGSTISTEKTLYFPDTEHTVPRYEKITVIYQDRHGAQHSLKAEGAFAMLLQRKIDYVFGGTLANRMDQKHRSGMEKELAQKGMVGSFETCPRVFIRDYFTSFMTKLLILEALTLLSPLFHFSSKTMERLYGFDLFVSVAMIFLLIGYFGVAYWESKKYSSCTSCQIGNIIGTTLKFAAAALSLFFAAKYLVAP